MAIYTCVWTDQHAVSYQLAIVIYAQYLTALNIV